MEKSLSWSFIGIVLVSLIGPSYSAQGQTWNELLKKSQVFRGLQSEPHALDSAIYYGQEALNAARSALGELDTNTAQISLHLGNCYFADRRFVAAESLLRQLVLTYHKTIGLENASGMAALNDLANLVDDLGRHDEGLRLTQQLLGIRIKVFGRNHVNVARSYTNLAVILIEAGRYVEAEPLLGRALKIHESLSPRMPWALAVTYTTLGSLFETEKRFSEAESLFVRASRLFAEVHGPRTNEVGMCVENIAECYFEQGRFEEAEPRFLAAIDIWHGIDSLNWWIPTALRRVAELRSATGKTSAVEGIYRRVIQLHNRELPADHPWMAEDLEGLANFYRNQKRYDEARVLYDQALSINRKKLSPTHDNFAICYGDLSTFYGMRGDWQHSRTYADSAYEIRWKNFKALSSGMSEYDALNYEALLRESADQSLTSYFKDLSSLATRQEEAAGVIFTIKGGLSEEVQTRNKRASQQVDSAHRSMLEAYRNVLRKISNSFIRHPDDDPTSSSSVELDSLTRLARVFESGLSDHVGGVGINLADQSLTARDLVRSMPMQGVLVEYLKFNYHGLDPKTSAPHYLVVVLDATGMPSIVDLGEAKKIDTEIAAYRNHFLQLATLKRPITAADQGECVKYSSRLYKLIWEPIVPKLKDGITLFISPDGGLNLVSFAGLTDAKGDYLIEGHGIHYLSAGRDLMRPRDRESSASGLIAFGDPDYDAPASIRVSDRSASAPLKFEGDTAAYSVRNVRSGCTSLGEMRVTRLTGTRMEVDSIVSYWTRDTRADAPLTFFGPDASEEHFMKYAPGRRVIHLSTHGYFLQGECSQNRTLPVDQQVFNENPLLQSGIFLAGANLHGEGADGPGAEDGILTALEVSTTELGGTDLVVLSACETGLGKVEQGEGVYGLRRAFQMAGAKTVVSSLWQVPDIQTMTFMKDLYAQRASTYPELMQKVMLKRINELRLRGMPTHPFSWAGFVATGDWRK